MTTIAQHLRTRADVQRVSTHPLVVGTGRVGVEVELENAQPLRLHYWDSIRDGSLRNNGQEYVMKQPIGGVDLFNAVKELDTGLSRLHPDASWRCSTHVHVDIRDLTVPQFKRFMLLYVMYEGIIFACSGAHRYQNNFCPAYGFAQEMIIRLAKVWDKDGNDFLRSINTSGRSGSRDKYSSLNLLPMFTQGSVEFRGSEPKYTKGKLLRLCNRLLSLKEFAITWEGTDQELITHVSATHPSKILLKSMPKKFEADPDLLHQGVKMAEDIIHLGDFTPPTPMVTIRRDRRLHWRDRTGQDYPENGEISADVLVSTCIEHRAWVGDFLRTGDFSILTGWAEENNVRIE